MSVDLAKENPQVAFVCGDRVTCILVRGSGELVVCFYDLESGHILQDGRGSIIQSSQPNAIRNGDQIIVSSSYGLFCFNSHGSLIKQVKVDYPTMHRKGYETCRQNTFLNVLDMCYYDQYAVLLLMESTIYRVDLQSGHSKLVTYVADNAKSIHCNNTFIFIGVSRESGSQSPVEKILVFDRVSGKLWFLHNLSRSLHCMAFKRIANPHKSGQSSLLNMLWLFHKQNLWGQTFW